MPPVSNAKSEGRAEVNVSNRSGDRVNEDDTSSSTQAQILLTALRGVIIPLVQAALPNLKVIVDLDHVPFGPEAEEFLVVLQKYIASIVQDQSRSESKAGKKQPAVLEEPLPMLSKTWEDAPSTDAKARHEISSQSGPILKRTVNLEGKISMIPRLVHGGGMRFSPPAPLAEMALNQALTSLRAHVFNTMPIRLLCFEYRGSQLDLTLLDRTGIYSHLASKLRDRFFQSDLLGLQIDQAVDIAVGHIPEIATYSILSHTWLNSSPGEVIFSDWYHGVFDVTHPGYRKLVNFCKIAAEEHEATLGWMDTVCINKESSAELDESIRSMYKWYQNARNCIVYLAETTIFSDMARDPWFTRGWTLQELLAPRRIIFYGAEWTTLCNGSFNDKEDRDVQAQITSATTITATDLMSPLSDIPISRKMQWAANRKVTRGEDIAYSLMGIFNVSISIAYGEGAGLAFTRLVKEILNITESKALDLLIWGGNYETNISALIPSSPAAYVKRGSEFDFGRMSLANPLTLTNWGLKISIVLMPVVPHRPGTSYTPRGDYSSTVDIHPALDEHAALRDSFNVVDRSFIPSPLSHDGAPLGLALAVLNCGGFDGSSVVLFKHCLAIVILYGHEDGVYNLMKYRRKVPTIEPISFQLNNRRKTEQDDWEYDIVPLNKLKDHGMFFTETYL